MIVAEVDHGSATATAIANQSAHHAHFSGSLALAMIRFDHAPEWIGALRGTRLPVPAWEKKHAIRGKLVDLQK